MLSLRARLILLVCFATVPAISFIFFAATKEREAALERMETEARHLGSLASREHAHQLAGSRNSIGRLASRLACDAGAPDRPPPCPSHLPELLSGLPQLANLGLADLRGDIVCSAAPVAQPATLAHNEAFLAALRSTEVEAGAYVVGLVGRPVLHMAQAVRTSSGDACAVAFVAVELGWLATLSEQAKLPPDYTLLITDRGGHVLARSGATAGELVEDQGRAVPALAEALHATHGAVLSVGSPPRARFFVSTPMEGVPGIHVVAGLPYERVQSTADRVFYRTLVGLVLVTIFAIVAAIVAAEISVLRVLRSLTRAVRRFGAGDLAARPPLPGSHGELRELAISFRKMADALAQRQREAEEAKRRLSALSRRLQLARDEEASRIARELHDELGQILTGLKMELAAVRRVCKCDDVPDEMGDPFSSMAARIDGAIDAVRRLSSQLRPPVLDRLGLAAAIDWLVHDCEREAGLTIVVEAKNLAEPLHPLTATTLFRIVQEALTNVVRHASASAVTVELAGSAGEIELSIHDDGTGIRAADLDGAHALGILGMRERVRLVGGDLTVRGAGGEGTTIVARVPRTPRLEDDASEGSEPA
ncbi:MAG: HAMP domain-containing protein [Polyangiaceae bacterium]|nr:HAMP domain-containing protein [Polyangiaceae bacterium]